MTVAVTVKGTESVALVNPGRPLQQTSLASWVHLEFGMQTPLVLVILDGFHKEVGLLLRGGGLNAMPQVHDMPLLAAHLEDRLCCSVPNPVSFIPVSILTRHTRSIH